MDRATDPLLALCAGDPAPFEEFVRSEVRTLVALFRRRGASLARAEDLAQEVFIKLYEGARHYQPRERFHAYCHRIARNVWIDDCRRLAAREGPALENLALFVASASVAREPGAALLLDEEQRDVHVLLAQLGPSHRRVFELVLLGELTYPEVATLLGIPVGTVKSRMFHAVRHLRRAWAALRRSEGVA